ncbi:MAG: undecaprenyl-diphosphate phosphatase [Oscillospiraceae bacterium]|jgi:undecaprenyl-diphosphatase|nr:undecaprenyl-diphosphate phosphatase [Oscillospiraceae bacterium]
MQVWQAAVLGIIQGLAEFLPISSSGHLLIGETLMDVQVSDFLLLEILLHVGTLVSVAIVFWRDIIDILRHPIKDKRLLMLVIATIPAVVATLLFGDRLESLFSGWFLGLSFIITAALLMLGETASDRIREARNDVGYKQAIAMGVMQAVAILPGVSRSGSTIVGGVSAGLTRESAARFSFLMSAVAIVGSLVFKFKDLLDSGNTVFASGWEAPAAGVLAAMVTGYLAIKFMLKLLQTKSLKPFAVYVTIVGALVLLDQLLFGRFFPHLF